jgi:transcription elongation GreA/GreB family factor
LNERKNIKAPVYNHLIDLLDRKIEVSMKAIKSTKESRDADTKSSVGDKYETGRAMMHIEQEKNEVQMALALKQKSELSKINIHKEYLKVGYGCLVLTNQGSYFISIGVGKLDIDQGNIYAISLVSPIGKQLEDKKKGDKFQFQGREFEILDTV